MEKTGVFFFAVLAAPILVMWMKIFIFYEVAFVLPLAAYLFILISMADQILQVKATTMNKGNQTETRPMRDQSVQTEDLCAIQSEEDAGSSSQPFAYLPGFEVTEMESSFVVSTDPSDDYTESSVNCPVAEWYLEYIRKKHEKKQVPFFRRKISKLFRKKKNKTS